MRNRHIALLTILALCATAPSALASGRDVIADCSDDEVMAKTYTQKEYREALAKLPADVDQYGNCRDIIARAQDAAAKKSSKKGATKQSGESTGATGAGAAQPPAGPSVQPASDQLATASAEDRAAAEDAAKNAAPVAARPGNPEAYDVGLAPGASAASDLPLPILVLLGLLLAGGLALAAIRIRGLVHTRRA